MVAERITEDFLTFIEGKDVNSVNPIEVQCLIDEIRVCWEERTKQEKVMNITTKFSPGDTVFAVIHKEIDETVKCTACNMHHNIRKHIVSVVKGSVYGVHTHHSVSDKIANEVKYSITSEQSSSLDFVLEDMVYKSYVTANMKAANIADDLTLCGKYHDLVLHNED